MMSVQLDDSNRGFTLIEMIVALVLAALMMAGLLNVVSSIAIESSQLQREQTDYIAAGVLADRLREDFINARGMLVSRDSISLGGYLSPQNLPSLLRYEVAMMGAQRCLLRRSGDQSEICWLGFGVFDYQPLEIIDAETPVPEMTGGLPPVPSRFRISARDTTGKILFSETIDHHAH